MRLNLFIVFILVSMIVGAGFVCWNLGRGDSYPTAKVESLPVNPTKPNQAEPDSKKTSPIKLSKSNSRSVLNQTRFLQIKRSSLSFVYRLADNLCSVVFSWVVEVKSESITLTPIDSNRNSKVTNL